MPLFPQFEDSCPLADNKEEPYVSESRSIHQCWI